MANPEGLSALLPSGPVSVRCVDNPQFGSGYLKVVISRDRSGLAIFRTHRRNLLIHLPESADSGKGGVAFCCTVIRSVVMS